jgi:hypothetical protein
MKKSPFFTLKGEKKDVDDAFDALRNEMPTTSLNKTNVSDTVTCYTLLLVMKNHPAHGEFQRQAMEAEVNWEHKGFTVQYHYTMTPAGADNTVYFDQLYIPCMETMSATMAAWTAFYRFVQNISE